jgi:hypothetical protein
MGTCGVAWWSKVGGSGQQWRRRDVEVSSNGGKL